MSLLLRKITSQNQLIFVSLLGRGYGVLVSAVKSYSQHQLDLVYQTKKLITANNQRWFYPKVCCYL